MGRDGVSPAALHGRRLRSLTLADKLSPSKSRIQAASTRLRIGLTATATLSSPYGEAMGEVTFNQGPRGVFIQARVSGLDAGAHGFHIHETGSCEPDFGAAGGHFNPTGSGHGPLHDGGHHAGDLPNLIAQSDGAGEADYYTADVTLASAVMHSLFDANGSAIVIHVAPDSYGQDAMAGGRVACGVISLD